jgi:peptidoglycan/xylan/chitin deacetylase (PgdA/CDA1 family)
VPLTILSYEEQVNELKKAKRVIEGVAGRIESFRAPMLRINEDTVRALEETGFLSDTSIASQRFDGPLTFGSKRKLKWLIAPRKPYMVSYDSIVKSGSSIILEIPISAALFPFIGTMMRISPFITKILQKYLYRESKKTGKPIVFLFHPNECLDVGNKFVATKRTNNPFEYLFADVIRHKLKLKNLGLVSVRLLDEVLTSAREYGFEFVSASEYTKMYKTNWHQ